MSIRVEQGRAVVDNKRTNTPILAYVSSCHFPTPEERTRWRIEQADCNFRALLYEKVLSPLLAFPY